MALHALDDVSDAFAATREFTRGLTAPTWLRLALIALLTGGVSAPTSGYQYDAGQAAPGNLPGPSAGGQFVAVLLAGIAVAILVALLLAVLGAILEFAFVEALRTDDVAIRRNVARYWGKGLRLFGFNVGIGLVVAAAFALAFVPLVFLNAVSAVMLLLFLPVAVLLAILATIVTGFTRAFVVPIMVLEDRNVLSAWRRLWGVLRADLNEYAAFFVVNFVLTLVGGILVAIGSLVVLAVDAVVVGIVFGLPFAFAGASGALAWAWLVIGIVLGAIAFLLGAGLVNAPVQSYLRYYNLLLLGDTQPALDLIPDRRAAIRDEVEE